MKEEKKQNDIIKKLKEQVEEKLKTISDNGIKSENLENLYKLIDIHKDISNEEYWDVKKEGEMNEMRYGNYNEYNGYYGDESYGRRQRDSRGRYMDGGSYGRRGIDRRYRGHDYLDDMYEIYGEYMEDRENGRYGSPEMDKAFDYMIKSATGFIDHVFKEIDSPEQSEKFKREIKMTLERNM